MALKIGIYNLDKNCGKSTTAVYLAESFATLSNSVLLIDLNSDAYLTSFLSISEKKKAKTLDSENLAEGFVQIRKSQSMWKYFQFGGDLETLINSLKEFENSFDYIFFDFPSFHSENTFEILKYLNSVIIPIESEFYGIENLNASLEKILECEGLLIEGILLTKYDSNNQIMPNLITHIKDNFSDIVFNSIISRNYYLGLPRFSIETLNHYTPHIGFADYLKLANEIIEKKKNE